MTRLTAHTGRDNLSSYGSSPGHLIAFSGVSLMMASGMDHSAVVEVVRPARLAGDDVILVEPIITVQWQAAECTTVCLRRQQRLALLRVRPHRDPLLAALLPIGMQLRVIRAAPPADLHKARDRGSAVPDQLRPLRVECPVAIAAEVAA